MSRATTVNEDKIYRAGSTGKKLAVIISLVLAFIVLAYVVFASLFPAAIRITPEKGERDVPVDSKIKISPSWLRGTITAVSVKEISLDAVGNSQETRTVDGHMDGDEFVPSDGSQTLKTDSRYEVTVSADLIDLTFTGPRHRTSTETYEFQTITTPAPLFMRETQVVAMGEPIIIEFNTPIEVFQYEIAPALATEMHIDEENPTRAFINFSDYQQGQKYQLTITGAVGQNGVGIKQPYSQTITTTEPLRIVFVPGDSEAGVSLSERPTLNFSENIRNPEVAESLVSMEPSVLGGWDWLDERTLEFRPLNDWTQGAQVTIRLKGGLDGLRGESGSYLREDVESSFTTKPSKLIDVDLTAQKVLLYDNDQLVKTLICSSGSKATPSLTGRYAIYAKAEKVDMRGEGYFAPDVPWVLMFNGDYTIHGNYWSTNFGTPTSHGCVGLPINDAEWLYDWAPIGTIVSIHY